jgi:hypothetical protein
LVFLIIRYLFAGIVIEIIKMIMLSGKYQKGKFTKGHKQEDSVLTWGGGAGYE